MVSRLYLSLFTLFGGCGIYALIHIPEYLSERAFILSMESIPQRGFIDLFSLWDLWIVPILMLSGSFVLPKFLKTPCFGMKALVAGAMVFGGSYFFMLVIMKIRGFFIYSFPFHERDFLISYLISNSGYILVFACLGALLIMVLSILKRP
ncbi:hypothetical protein [Kiloniella majae]|uniref:hypothetical protein n=1 Tax=Kiloniella majae TaxID=1938558 RepID=UPI000A277596|nr:hypothetical protein [Kiloniella majae]